MQFAVPQFVDIEDKLIGPLTLKQFLMLLGTGGAVLFVWSILGVGIIFFAVAIPVAIAGIAITFGKFNGRPLYVYLMPLFSFLSSPKVWVFRRETAVVSFSNKKVVQAKPAKLTGPEDNEAPDSRLRKLAYLLDQKHLEEEELIKGDQIPK
ncbi:MAG: PrgI family protein [Candidatus Saccharibacteria bacterium]